MSKRELDNIVVKLSDEELLTWRKLFGDWPHGVNGERRRALAGIFPRWTLRQAERAAERVHESMKEMQTSGKSE